MTTFALLHGTYMSGAHWDLVARDLRARGHTVVAPDLPITDPEAGAEVYAACVEAALEGHDGDLIVAAHGIAGLAAPLIAERTGARHLVYVNAHVPTPGRSFDQIAAEEPSLFPRDPQAPPRADGDGSASSHPAHATEMYFHDCTWQRTQWACSLLRPQQWRILHELSPLHAFPAIASTAIIGRFDRALAPETQRQRAEKVTGATIVEVDTGHCPMIALPEQTAELLDALCR